MDFRKEDVVPESNFEETFKSSVFGVFFILLKSDNPSFAMIKISLIWDLIQLLAFPFNSQIDFDWKTDFQDSIKATVNAFQLPELIKSTSWSLYIFVLYVFILLVFLMLLNISVVLYWYNRRKFRFIWPLHLLRSIFSMFNAILFLPFAQMFASLFNCVREDNETSYHYSYENVNCWEGFHVLHSVLTASTAIIWVTTALLISLLYFESKRKSLNKRARDDGPAEMVFVVYKIVLVVSFTVLNAYKYQWWLVAIYFLGGWITFLQFYVEKPFFNQQLTDWYRCILGINLWTGFCLVAVKALQYADFEAGIALWFCGIPLVILSILSKDNVEHYDGLTDISEARNDWDFLKKMRYLSQIFSWDISKAIAINIKGTLFEHKQRCLTEECHLHSLKKLRFKRSHADDFYEANRNFEGQENVCNFMNYLFIKGIQKFDHSAAIRVSYSHFLLERMASQQLALSELNQAELLDPTLTQEFMIYRLRKYIEDEMTESQQAENNKGMDIIDLIAFENHLKLCRHYIEKSSILHAEFWTQLQEEQPNIVKLTRLSSTIHTINRNLEDQWNKLTRINPNMPSALSLYGRYIRDILNDPETGSLYIMKAQTIANSNYYKRLLNTMNDNHETLMEKQEGEPAIIISGESETLGIIKHVNGGTSRLFGFTGVEFQDQNVTMVIPEPWASHHPKFLDNFVRTGVSTIFNRERANLFGKHKSGYLMPIFITMKPIPAAKSGINFLGMIKNNRSAMEDYFFITTPDLKIIELTANCTRVFNISYSSISKESIPMETFVPDISEEGRRTVYMDVGDEAQVLTASEDSSHGNLWGADHGLGSVREMHCRCEPIHFHASPGLKGFIIRLSEPKNAAKDKSRLNHSTLASARKSNSSQREKRISEANLSFEFRFLPKYGQILGDFYTTETKQDDDDGGEEGLLAPIYAASHYGTPELLDDDSGNGDLEPGFSPSYDIVTRHPTKKDKNKKRKRKKKRKSLIEEGDDGELKVVDLGSARGKSVKQLLSGGGGRSGRHRRLDDSEDEDNDSEEINSDDSEEDSDEEAGGSESEGDDSEGEESGSRSDGDEGEEENSIETESDSDEELSEGSALSEEHIDININYAEGIVTKTLLKGPKPTHEEIKRKLMEKEEKEFAEGLGDSGIGEIEDTFKSKKNLNAVLKEKRVTSRVRKLQLFTLISLFLLLLIAAGEYFLTDSQFSQLNSNVRLIEYSNGLAVDVQDILTYVRNLEMLENEILSQGAIDGMTAKQYYRDQINDTISSLKNHLAHVDLENVSLSDKHERLTRDPVIETISRLNSEIQVEYHILNDVLMQYVSHAFTITKIQDALTSSNDDVFFVIQNGFGHLFEAMMQSSEYYVDDLEKLIASQDSIFLWLLLGSIVALLTLAALTLPIIRDVYRRTEQVLVMFFDIPPGTVKMLAQRCENFAQSLQEESVTDVVDSEMSQISKSESLAMQNNFYNSERMGSSKGYKNRGKRANFVTIQLGFILLVLQAYYVTNFLLSHSTLRSLEDRASSFEVTSSAEPTFLFCYNSIRELIFSDGEQKILDRDPLEVSKEYLTSYGKIPETILEENLKNGSLHEEDYIALFDDLFIENVCRTLFASSTVDYSECGQFAGEILPQGLRVAMMWQFNNLRVELNNYITYKPMTLEEIKTEMNSELMARITTMQFEYVKPSFGKLVSAFSDDLTTTIDNSLLTKQFLFACFTTVMVVLYIWKWRGFIDKLTNDIWRSTAMLSIIPLEIISKLDKIKVFLKEREEKTHNGLK